MVSLAFLFVFTAGGLFLPIHAITISFFFFIFFHFFFIKQLIILLPSL